MFCRNCGSPLQTVAKFCTQCGERVDHAREAVSSEESAQRQPGVRPNATSTNADESGTHTSADSDPVALITPETATAGHDGRGSRNAALCGVIGVAVLLGFWFYKRHESPGAPVENASSSLETAIDARLRAAALDDTKTSRFSIANTKTGMCDLVEGEKLTDVTFGTAVNTLIPKESATPLPAILARHEFTCVSRGFGTKEREEQWVVLALDEEFQMVRCLRTGPKDLVQSVAKSCDFTPRQGAASRQSVAGERSAGTSMVSAGKPLEPIETGALVGKYNGSAGLSLQVRRQANSAGLAASIDIGTPRCLGAFAGSGEVKDNVLRLRSDDVSSEAQSCVVTITFSDAGKRAAMSESSCSWFHGAECEFSGQLTKEGSTAKAAATGGIADLPYQIVAAALKGDSATVEDLLAKALMQPKPLRGDRKAARQLNEQGLAAYQQDNFGEAARYFKRAFDADAGDVEIRENLGLAMFREGMAAEAAVHVVSSLNLNPNRASAWGSLGQIYAVQGKTQEAVTCLILAYRVSRNKQKTLDMFTQLAASDGSPQVRTAMSEAVRILQTEIAKGK